MTRPRYAAVVLTLVGSPAMSAGPLALEAFAFTSPEERARAIAVRSVFASRFAGGQTAGPRELGNFVSLRFCRKGANEAACDGGAIASERAPGTGYGQVEVLHYELPKVFGLLVSTGDVPDGPGIAVNFHYTSTRST